MPVVHLVARLRDRHCGRLDGEHAPWLYERLKERFPNALGATLMRNHPHLIADVDDVAAGHAAFIGTLRGFAHHLHWGRGAWARVPPPKILVGADKIAKDLRYIALNPAWAGLTDDPLAWIWSTYRDLFGAAADPWVSFGRLRKYLPSRLQHSLERFHRFVSADEATHLAGTPMVRPLHPLELQMRPLGEIVAAAAAATRRTTDHVRRIGPTRDVFVRLAAEQGWHDATKLAEICGVTPRAIHKMLAGPPPRGLAAARLCLGDDRLRRFVSSGREPTPRGRDEDDRQPPSRA